MNKAFCKYCKFEQLAVACTNPEAYLDSWDLPKVISDCYIINKNNDCPGYTPDQEKIDSYVKKPQNIEIKKEEENNKFKNIPQRR